MSRPDWIAADWGTSHLRVWAMQGGTVLDKAQSDAGMAKLDAAQFEGALLDLIGPWLGDSTLTVVACGMVGARQGWVEAPYGAIPTTPVADGLVQASTNDPRLNVWVIPGLKQTAPADVMRGEETQIAGFLALNDGWDGVICLPGTHTKWAHVSAGEVVSFQTFMTGEQFALLTENSVLKHSIGTGWDDTAFKDALNDTMSRPERLAAYLFNLRARDLLEGFDADSARARLSGLLLGAELSAARPFWLGQNVAIIGDDTLARAYAMALDAQGVPALVADAARMTLAGLHAAYRTTKDS
ncbi:2-dehydro-3-deoxygalactonokinase [Ascidiaceihabitans sp.]|uniref:2-dehydro-3-deoxygalactonokinase n=1 Tax=Ascidiaceihabitans sp. TaxID=1872644 RepID=UPI003296948C